MLEQLKLEHFADRVGERFRITPVPSEAAGAEDEPAAMPSIELTLIEAHGLSSPPSEMRSPFSLLFQGPAEPLLDQQIHPLEHEEMGELSLFLVPLGPGGEGLRYEAVFT